MYSLKGMLGHIFMKICGLLPLRSKAVFVSFSGCAYSDNPRAIYVQMRESTKKVKYIWLLEDKNIKIKGAKVVKVNSFRSLFHLATAKLWVDNCRKREWIVKRKKQYYVQTWHGGFALKKVEADVADKLSAQYIKNARHDSEMADLFISGCKWCSDNYRSAFWYDGEILEYGQPRSDIFYGESGGITKKVYDFYGLNPETKIALYAPTFRVGHEVDCYDVDYEKLLSALSEKWGGEWKVIVRLHPNIADKQNIITYSEKVLNGSAYQDINELIVASDVLISDYSSCMFDAMEAGKKVLLYASDLDNYNEDRGTYIPMNELPFTLATDNEQLSKNINSFDEQNYIYNVNSFKQKIGYFNSANAAKKTADYILKHTGLI